MIKILYFIKFSNLKLLILILSLFLLYSFVTENQVYASTSELYVTNASDNIVTEIDPNSGNIINTITVGDQPRMVASHDNYIYVSNMYGHSISVIDSNTNNIIATIPLGIIYPERISISNDGKRLYTGDPFLTQVAVIDTTSNTVAKILNGFVSPQTSIESTSGKYLYVVNQNFPNENGWVSVLNTSDYSKVTDIKVGYVPSTIALTPDGVKAYVGNFGVERKGNTVSVINTTTNTVIKTISVGINPYTVIINSTGTRLYVINSYYWAGGSDRVSNGTVSVIDTSNDSVIATIQVGFVPHYAALSQDNKLLYVTNNFSNTISVIDTNTNTVIKTINAGNNPWGIAITESSSESSYVPLLKQGIKPFDGIDPWWEREEYDHGASQYLSCGTTIADCGCAITSLSMLLRRYGVPDPDTGDLTNPHIINNYFNQNNKCGELGCISLGYLYGNVRWGVANNYAAEANRNYQTQKIVYNASESGLFNWNTTKRDIDHNRPVIISVNNNTHWVIATQSASNTFRINDPYFPYNFLSDHPYNNEARQMRRYEKTNSDFSAIEIGIKAPSQIIITDPDGNKTGYDVNKSSTITEIQGSNYYFDSSYSVDPNPQSDNGVYFIYLQTPQKGNYRLDIIGDNNQPYSFGSYITDRDANTYFKLNEGVINSSIYETYFITYDPDSITPLFITKSNDLFEKLKTDLNKYYTNGNIDNKGIYNSLMTKVENAEKEYISVDQSQGLKQTLSHLKTFISELNAQKNKHIELGAYQVLLDDANAIIQKLTR